MKLVVDTSILIGALVKRGHLLFKLLRLSKNFELVSPDFLKEELNSKRDKIAKLSMLSKEEVEFAMDVLTSFVKIVSKDIYSDKIEEAKEIAKQI